MTSTGEGLGGDDRVAPIELTAGDRQHLLTDPRRRLLDRPGTATSVPHVEWASRWTRRPRADDGAAAG